MKILGIETSCDETAAAVVESGNFLRSSAVASSLELHKLYGGIVPEVAARSHVEVIIPTLKEALSVANCIWQDIDAIAVTYGAGLSGSLLIGVLTARTLAIILNKPLIAANHVESHIYANFITKTTLPGYVLPAKPPRFPFLGLIVSGGHSQLVLFRNHFDYQLLGKTQDDAIGEAFDKVAKMLGLAYPGGPSVSKLAKKGDALAIHFPKPHMPGYDFSYSGLKTAVLRYCQSSIGERFDFPSTKLSERLNEAQKATIAASFERTAVQMISDKVKQALKEYPVNSVIVAGGVAANQELRRQLAEDLSCDIYFPDIKLCTDNAAMVASLGYYKFASNQPLANPYTLGIEPSLSM